MSDKYVISEQKIDGQQSLYRIDYPGMPSYYTRSWQELGKSLAKLEISDEDIEFRDLRDPGKHMILAFFHANKVLNRSKIPELERIVKRG